MTKLENALIWLYMKTWGKFGDHITEEKDLWNFSGDDMEKVIVGLAFPRKKEKSERVRAVTDLIMEKFEQDKIALYEWAANIHNEVIENLQENSELYNVPTPLTTVKILKWCPGKYYEFLSRISRVTG